MFNIILFGPPGSGKGTQSTNLINKYNFYHISTGDLLRSEIAHNTPLGIEAKHYMDDGKLVPDTTMIGMIKNTINDNPQVKGFIFDGFPRTVAQAEALDEMLQTQNSQIDVLLSLEVPEEELKRRLLSRGEVSGRSDDNEETIHKRIIEYRAKTEAVATHYHQKDKLVKIPGTGTIEEIFNTLQEAIDQRL